MASLNSPAARCPQCSNVQSNVQTKKQTDLVYDDYVFDTDLSDSDFVKGRLSRLR